MMDREEYPCMVQDDGEQNLSGRYIHRRIPFCRRPDFCYNRSANAGDIMIVWFLLTYRSRAETVVYMDHPTQAGGVIFEK